MSEKRMVKRDVCDECQCVWQNLLCIACIARQASTEHFTTRFPSPTLCRVGFRKKPRAAHGVQPQPIAVAGWILYRFFLSKLEPRFLWARHQNNHRFVSVQHHILVSSHQKKQCDFDDTPSKFNSLELTGLLDLLYIMYTRAGPLIWK